jgi:hypothetical protein
MIDRLMPDLAHRAIFLLLAMVFVGAAAYFTTVWGMARLLGIRIGRL